MAKSIKTGGAEGDFSRARKHLEQLEGKGWSHAHPTYQYFSELVGQAEQWRVKEDDYFDKALGLQTEVEQRDNIIKSLRDRMNRVKILESELEMAMKEVQAEKQKTLDASKARSEALNLANTKGTKFEKVVSDLAKLEYENQQLAAENYELQISKANAQFHNEDLKRWMQEREMADQEMLAERQELVASRTRLAEFERILQEHLSPDIDIKDMPVSTVARTVSEAMQSLAAFDREESPDRSRIRKPVPRMSSLADEIPSSDDEDSDDGHIDGHGGDHENGDLKDKVKLEMTPIKKMASTQPQPYPLDWLTYIDKGSKDPSKADTTEPSFLDAASAVSSDPQPLIWWFMLMLFISGGLLFMLGNAERNVWLHANDLTRQSLVSARGSASGYQAGPNRMLYSIERWLDVQTRSVA